MAGERKAEVRVRWYFLKGNLIMNDIAIYAIHYVSWELAFDLSVW